MNGAIAVPSYPSVLLASAEVRQGFCAAGSEDSQFRLGSSAGSLAFKNTGQLIHRCARSCRADLLGPLLQQRASPPLEVKDHGPGRLGMLAGFLAVDDLAQLLK